MWQLGMRLHGHLRMMYKAYMRGAAATYLNSTFDISVCVFASSSGLVFIQLHHIKETVL